NGVSDLTSLGSASVSLTQGDRFCWACSSSDVRALQSPDQSTRHAATYYDANQIDATLSFPNAYSGNLRLYALDWDSNTRRESITINDGNGPQTKVLAADFSQGAWVTFPVNVAASGTISISVTRTAGNNAVLAGIFLGDAGAPLPAPFATAPQGDWVN